MNRQNGDEAPGGGDIKTITTPFSFGISVNCYLVRAGEGYVLIDTGMPNRRTQIKKALEDAGCRAGAVKLIVLTHGDIDHCGNAAYFRKKFGAQIAMHADDAGMVELGEFFWSRKKRNAIMRWIMNTFFALSPRDRFKPDRYLSDGASLAEFGLDAQIVSLPGHSRGSIGVLTRAGDLFCGDLLANTEKPELWSIIDDDATANESVEKLKRLDIGAVYPGHGRSFAWDAFLAMEAAR